MWCSTHPAGIHGFELARVVMFADAIIMPVCHSVFDRESAAACHAELMALPRVASGRCRLATVGMRIDGRTSAGQKFCANGPKTWGCRFWACCAKPSSMCAASSAA
jgi:hypothetical protein